MSEDYKHCVHGAHIVYCAERCMTHSLLHWLGVGLLARPQSTPPAAAAAAQARHCSRQCHPSHPGDQAHAQHTQAGLPCAAAENDTAGAAVGSLLAQHGAAYNSALTWSSPRECMVRIVAWPACYWTHTVARSVSRTSCCAHLSSPPSCAHSETSASALVPACAPSAAAARQACSRCTNWDVPAKCSSSASGLQTAEPNTAFILVQYLTRLFRALAGSPHHTCSARNGAAHLKRL